MRRGPVAAAAVWLTCWLGAAATPAPAAAPSATIHVVPSSAALGGDARTGLRVIVDNTSPRPLEHVVVRTLRGGAAGISLHLQRRRPIEIAPGSSRTWKLLVKDTGGATVGQKIAVIARFKTLTDEGTRVSGVVHAKADLEPAAVPDPAKVGSLKLYAVLTTLRSGKKETVYLVLVNKSAATMHVERVDSKVPDFLTVTGGDDPIDVAPGDTALISLVVAAGERVRPGEHQLVFSVPVQLGRRKGLITLTAAKTVDVAVAGESALLTVLGVPALFVVPGFLIFATMSLLWSSRLLRKKWDADAFFMDVKSAEFWVAAVTLSIPIVIVWPHVGGGDLLDQYGLDDVVAVWITSILLGTLAYVAYVLVRNHRREDVTPSTGDDPIRILEKIHKQGLTVIRERREYLDSVGTTVLYAVQSLDDDRPATWMSPAIDYSGPDDDAPLAALIERHLNETHDAGSLAAALGRGRAAGTVTVDWSADAHPINGPRPIDKDKIGGDRGADAIVHEV